VIYNKHKENYEGFLMSGEDWQTGVGTVWVAWNGPPIHLLMAHATEDTTIDEVNTYIKSMGEQVAEEVPTMGIVVRARAHPLQSEIEVLENLLARLKKKSLGDTIAKEADKL